MTRTPILGTSACIFRAGQILLVERRNAPFQGKLSLPGGRVEFGEHLAAAISREVREETSLAIDRFAFFCLHEAIEDDVHVVIAVHRASEALRPGVEPVAADDALSVRFVAVEELTELEAAERLTSGLRRIVESAHREHLLGI